MDDLIIKSYPDGSTVVIRPDGLQLRKDQDADDTVVVHASDRTPTSNRISFDEFGLDDDFDAMIGGDADNTTQEEPHTAHKTADSGDAAAAAAAAVAASDDDDVT